MGKVIPEHRRVVCAGQVSSRVTLLGVNEVRELGGISQEENWCVVSDQVPVALFGTHLDGKSTRIASTIVGTGFTADSGEADSDGSFFPCSGEEIGETKVWARVCALEDSMGAGTFGVDDSLGNALAIEVGQEVH